MTSCLIVDDSAVIRRIIRRIYEDMGFSCVEAEDGKKACDACTQQMPDIIMLDWNMPVMNGIDFIRVLRALPDGCVPKVLFCTTENGIEAITTALDAGADEYIMKPFDKDIIYDKLFHLGLLTPILSENQQQAEYIP